MPPEITAPVSDEDQMAAALVELRESRSTGTEAAGDPAGEAQAASDAAAGAAAATDKPAGDPAGKPAEAAAAEGQPEAKTPEQLLAEKQAELHRVTSEIGRVNALNRKNMENAQRIAALERDLAEARKAPPATQADALSELAALKERVGEFPELASLVDVVDKALKELEGKAKEAATAAAKEVTAPLEPLRQRDLDRQVQEQEAADSAASEAFAATYPTAVEVVKSDEFKAWLPKQSKAIQWAFFKGETPADAMPVMDAFDAHLRRSGKPPIAHTPTTTQQPAAQEHKQPASDRLSRAAGIPSRTGGAKGSMPAQDDFEGSLEFFRNKRLADQRARAGA